jgi:phage/plasmid-like protein (TIGR03299 family)
MAHMIDMTTGKAAMAYVGEAPWHKLGQALTAGASIDDWRREAGLDYTVERAPVEFRRPGADATVAMADRDVLYRSDTGTPLSVVSKAYNVVQPGEVLEFFGKLAEVGGFALETAGALSDGKRVWGLAKVNDGAPVVGTDQVRPYLLLATSYDGTMATTAKFTAIRVVCNNTLTMAAGSAYGSQSERDTTEGNIVQCVRVNHSARFDAGAVRRQLGIVINAWDRWIVEAKAMADVYVGEATADRVFFDLLSSVQNAPKDRPLPDVRKGKAYQRLMGLFDGGQIGADLCGTGNAWALLNSVTQLVDHERGNSDDTRMTSAWFGAGEGLKLKAWDAVRDLCVKAGALEPIAA